MGGAAMRKLYCYYRVSGVSLVELMVAITIGLIITAAISTVFVTSKQTYNTQDKLARLQENGRFALQFIAKDLRLAGYYGCIDQINNMTVYSMLESGGPILDNFLTPLEATEGGANASDSITLRSADPANGVFITKEMPNTSAELDVNSLGSIKKGDIIMLSDCSSADVMQVTGVQDSPTRIQHNPGTETPGNKNPAWTNKPYGKDSKIMKFRAVRYFIANNARGTPVLFRAVNGEAPEELVEGIEQLQLLYGKDTDGDRAPNIYLKAGQAGLQTATDWSQVVTIRIGVLARTITEEGTDVDVNDYDVDDDGDKTDRQAPNDRHKRRIFLATVRLRNLP